MTIYLELLIALARDRYHSYSILGEAVRMWHFRIPDTGEAEDRKGPYTVFNIHVNGFYHCSVRYSILLEFFLEVRSPW